MCPMGQRRSWSYVLGPEKRIKTGILWVRAFDSIILSEHKCIYCGVYLRVYANDLGEPGRPKLSLLWP